MHKLLFFSRVAFICNCCFGVTFLLHYFPVLPNGWITSTIIVLGNLLAIVINGLINILYVILTIREKGLPKSVPPWLLIANFLFFLFQLILLFK
ncbi:MAG: hypothetical protein ABI687_08065 [Flavitalea sp.]